MSMATTTIIADDPNALRAAHGQRVGSGFLDGPHAAVTLDFGDTRMSLHLSANAWRQLEEVARVAQAMCAPDGPAGLTWWRHEGKAIAAGSGGGC